MNSGQAMHDAKRGDPILADGMEFEGGEPTRLSDERLDFHQMNVDECLEVEGPGAKYQSVTNDEMDALCTELRDRRAQDADLRVLIEGMAMAATAIGYSHGRRCLYPCPAQTDDCDASGDDSTRCRAALLAHFGIAPEPGAER